MKLDPKLILVVAVGGAVGSALRYVLSLLVQTKVGASFPTGTLVINGSGSLLLGFLMRYGLESTSASPEVRLLLTTGLCGGYTTFSTFSYETARLLEDGEHWRAALYIVLSVALSLGGMFIGFIAARGVLAARSTV